MTIQEFKEKSIEVSVKFRAKCKSKNNHWTGTWRDTYSEAESDADRHRYGGNGQNEFHKIIIEEKSSREANY